MTSPQYSIERATNGLVLALFLAGAILLVYILFQILGNEKERQAKTGNGSAPSTYTTLHQPLRSGAFSAEVPLAQGITYS